MQNEKRILTPEDIAAECGICLRTVYKQLRAGNIRHTRAGDKYLISRANFEKWLSGECNREKAVC